jgi:hypothetical protein
MLCGIALFVHCDSDSGATVAAIFPFSVTSVSAMLHLVAWEWPQELEQRRVKPL